MPILSRLIQSAELSISSVRWQRLAGAVNSAYNSSPSARHQSTSRKENRWKLVPLVALSAFPLLTAYARSNENKGEDPFYIPETKRDANPESLNVIEKCKVVAKVIEQVSPAVVSIISSG